MNALDRDCEICEGHQGTFVGRGSIVGNFRLLFTCEMVEAYLRHSAKELAVHVERAQVVNQFFVQSAVFVFAVVAHHR